MRPQQDDPDTRSGESENERGTITIAHHAPGLTIVALLGEHDISTEPRLSRALNEAAKRSDVLVDLSECRFIDSSVIRVLASAARAAAARGERLELAIPATQAPIRRISELARLDELLTIHDTREAALASLEGRP